MLLGVLVCATVGWIREDVFAYLPEHEDAINLFTIIVFAFAFVKFSIEPLLNEFGIKTAKQNKQDDAE